MVENGIASLVLMDCYLCYGRGCDQCGGVGYTGVYGLAKGTQVIYTPPHLGPDARLGYPNGRQPGFVTSFTEKGIFVRYWMINNGIIMPHLRTVANSELTPGWNLRVASMVPSAWVFVQMEKIKDGEHDS